MIKLNKVGIFPAKISSTRFIESSKGNPGLRLISEVTSGECIGHSIPIDLWLDDTKVSPKDNLTCFDRTMAKLVEVFDFAGTDIDQLVGKDCSIETEEEEFETSSGKVARSIKVKYLNRAGGSAADLDKAKVSSIAAKMGKAAAILAKQAALTAPRTTPTAAAAATNRPGVTTTGGDDDVPF